MNNNVETCWFAASVSPLTFHPATNSLSVCMRDVTHSYLCHDSHIWVTWHSMRDVTHSYLCHDSHIWVTWHTPSHIHTRTHTHPLSVCMRDVTHSYPSPEASWRRGFEPYAPLLFDLYHYLEQNGHFGLVTEHAPGPSSQLHPGSSWLPGSTPAGSQEGFRAVCQDSYIWETWRTLSHTHTRTRTHSLSVCMCDVTHSYLCPDSYVWVYLVDVTHTHTHTCTQTHTYSLWPATHLIFVRMHESSRTYEWVMSNLWISHITHMNKSCHTCEWIMSHMWTSHVTHMNESRHTYEWVISHICMTHVTYMNESRHTYEWVMSHIWMSICACDWLIVYVRRIHYSVAKIHMAKIHRMPQDAGHFTQKNHQF